MREVGLVGLGLLGTAIAQRLIAGGYTVFGYDIADARLEHLQQLGGEAASSSAAVFARCGYVVLSLPDSKTVAQLIDPLEDSMRGETFLIDTSTGDPEDAVRVATRLESRQVVYLDATVLGSSVQTRERQALVMVGGSKAGYASCREILEQFGREVFYVGPAGSGARMKLVVNLVLGLNRAALAEGLSLARVLGLDRTQALEILRAGGAYSAVMDTKGEKMLAGDFAPQARLSQHLKDVRLMLAAAARTGAVLPLSDVHRHLLEKAEAAGYGEQDNSAILRAYDET